MTKQKRIFRRAVCLQRQISKLNCFVQSQINKHDFKYSLNKRDLHTFKKSDLNGMEDTTEIPFPVEANMYVFARGYGTKGLLVWKNENRNTISIMIQKDGFRGKMISQLKKSPRFDVSKHAIND